MRGGLKGGGVNLGSEPWGSGLRSLRECYTCIQHFSVRGTSILPNCVIENKSFLDALTCPCIEHRLSHMGVLGQVFQEEVTLLCSCCTGNLCIRLRDGCMNGRAGASPAGTARHLETLEEPKNMPQFSVTVSLTEK